MYSLLSPPLATNFPPLLCANAAGRLLHSDSRQIKAGDIFLACQGEYADGRSYIPAAIANGASFVFWDDDGAFQWNPEWNVPNQGIKDLKHRAGILAARLYGNVSDGLSSPLKIWGVTGTNGKTSITQWLAQAAGLLGDKTAIIGTVGNGFWGALEDTTHTTPAPVEVQSLLHRFRKQGATAAAMEVSSHGLDQARVNGVPFQTAVFTNLTRDHLDYHGTMEAYGAIKSRLFYWRGLKHAVINSDDPYGAELIGRLKADRPDLAVYSYGFGEQADIRITGFAAASDGMEVALDTPWGKGSVKTRLLGRFNAQNLAACVGVLCADGHPLDKVLAALEKIRPATGRMDCIIESGKPLVVVDYAHTPDALEKALATLQEIKPQGADKVVVTSDNPRLENPADIIADILPAVPAPECVEADRKAAIGFAVKNAASDDIILIAGKGHETYQDVAGVKHHFSDFETAQAALAERG